MDIKIEKLDVNSPSLSRVIELGDANSATLGFLPHAAFKQAARQGNILVAVAPDNYCVGYLLFRVVKTKQKVSITHLCVDSIYRGNGIARNLVDAIKDYSKDWSGISLSSRRDYATNTFWENTGFVAVGEKIGRGQDKMPLTIYWYDFQHPNLFSLAHNHQIESKSAHAVLDANIVYTLHENPNHPLLADWLLDDVFLCITPEMFNEINRRKNDADRKLMRGYVRGNFPQIDYDNKKYEISYEIIKNSSSLNTSRPQNKSDLKQIAYAVAGNAEFFVTEDEKLISNYSDNILTEFGLKIIRPDDLIIHLDEHMNSAKYQQNRLAGSSIKISRVTSGQSDLLAQTFQVQKSEKKVHFAKLLRQCLAEPHKFETNIVTTSTDELLALFVYSKTNTDVLEVPVLRVIDGMNLSALASHLIFRAVQTSIKNEKKLVNITDEHLSNDVLQGLDENSFSKQGDSWIKINIQGVFQLDQIETKLKSIKEDSPLSANLYPFLIDKLAKARQEESLQDLMELERFLWPMKIDHQNIPSFLTSILPDWAADLFDSTLGNQTLLGSDPDLILKMDNVYYRSARPKLPTNPSRILWYVTKKKQYQGDMSIRACSYVDEVIVGTPKDLFKKFSKLGVYNWQNVYDTAEKKADKKILAFRFSRTELFKRPIPLSTLKEVLNRKSAPQSPVKLGLGQFEKLYRIGTDEDESYEK